MTKGFLRLHRLALLLLAGCAGDPQVQHSGEPVIVPGVSVGMSRSAVVQQRPRATDNSGILSERIGPDETVTYWFGRNFDLALIPANHLAVVVRSSRPSGAEAVDMMDEVQRIEHRWTKLLGQPDTIPARSLVRRQGTSVRLHARIWSSAGRYVILTFERASDAQALTKAYSVIMQDRRLNPEESLPDS